MRTLFTGVRMSSPACALGEYAHESFLLMCAYFVPRGTQKLERMQNQTPFATAGAWLRPTPEGGAVKS